MLWCIPKRPGTARNRPLRVQGRPLVSCSYSRRRDRAFLGGSRPAPLGWPETGWGCGGPEPAVPGGLTLVLGYSADHRLRKLGVPPPLAFLDTLGARLAHLLDLGCEESIDPTHGALVLTAFSRESHPYTM